MYLKDFLSIQNIFEIAKISNISGGMACEEVGVVTIDKDKLLEKYNNQ